MKCAYKNNKTQFIIALDGSAYKPMYEHMFSELTEKENVTFVTDKVKNTGLKNFLLKNKVRKVTAGIFDFLAYEENNLYEAIKFYSDKGKNVYVIFVNATFRYNSYLPKTLLHYKQKFENLRYILFYLDIMNVGVSMTADKLRESGMFDLVYSIDENDVKKTSAIFWHTFYSKDNRYSAIKPITDMYFCGVSKGRTEILAAIADKAKENKAKIKFDIIACEDVDAFKYCSTINLHELGDYLSYPEVLNNELKGSVILEVVQEGQVAPTLRPYEAVIYNRKLLTNNPNIKKFPYWDSKYMRYFSCVEDIDWKWVKDNTEVDYKYDGRFSPNKLLEDICIRLGEI